VPLPARAPAGLRASGLSKRFGPVTAVEGVSLELAPGTITALVGPNGSGKTTLLRLLAGAQAADAGVVVVGDRDLAGLSAAERVAAGVVRTLQGRPLFDELSVLENVLVGIGRTRRHAGALKTLTSTPAHREENELARRRGLAALEIVELRDHASRPAASLTTFEQRLLALAAALATNPAVILIDEPSAGAGANELRRLAAVLHGLRQRGLTLLLVEHNLRLVRETSDRVLVLANGRVVAAGTPEQVAAAPAAQQAYLGPTDRRD
jgi:ABC-type branched-subunit amino acid transport system ATPase component